MLHSPSHARLHALKDDLEALKRRAERQELGLVATLLGMAILDIEAALLDEEDGRGHLDS